MVPRRSKSRRGPLGMFVTPRWRHQLSKPLEWVRSGKGLAAQVFRGGMWLGMGLASEQIVRFARNMLLARLLAPAAFGTMAIVASATTVIHTMMDIGVKDAVIQNRRGSEDDYVNAAWWMAFARSLFFWTILFILAPWIARFYGNLEISRLLRVCATGLIFDGAMSSRAHVAVKEMQFRKWALINHLGGISGVLFTIFLSFFIRDVWALVIGSAAESAARCVLSFAICPFLPTFKWSLEAARNLWSFSRRMLGLSFLNLVFARTDIFVLAKMTSPGALGLYTMAVYMVQTPTSFIMSLLGQTVLPAFARVQEDKDRTNRILLQVTSMIALLGLPALVFSFFCGRSMLTLAYGSQYAAAGGPLIVASAVALVNLLNGQLTSVFFAAGRPHLHRFSIMVMATTMAVLIYPSVHYFGIVGAQLSCLVAVSVGFLLQLGRVHRLTGLDLPRYGRLLFKGALVSLSVVGACVSTRALSFSVRPLGNVLSGIMGCFIAYAICMSFFLQQRQKLAS